MKRIYLFIILAGFIAACPSCKKDQDKPLTEAERPPATPGPYKLSLVYGNGQLAPVNSTLTALVVAVRTASDDPAANVSVAFKVVSGGGSLSAPTVLTDSDGNAYATWQLGATEGTQKVTASISSAADVTPVEFSATALGPISLAIVTGNDQTTPNGGALTNPLVVKTVDKNGTPVAYPGMSVAFSVSSGGGSLKLFMQSKILSNGSNWSVEWVLGAGAGNQKVTAVARNANGVILGKPAEFTASRSGPALSGVVVAGGNGVGTALNQVTGPCGIFLDEAKNLYVAENNNDRVVKWAPGASSGTVVAGGNGTGAAANQLNSPRAVFVDASGAIYVADTYNLRVQKWLPGASTGITVAGGNGAGNALNQMQPEGLWVDKSGAIYVVDKYNSRIQKWLPGASSGVIVAGGRGNGSADGYGGLYGGGAADQLWQPSAIWLDADDNMYITDTHNNRVQKWAKGASSGITVAGGYPAVTDYFMNPTTEEQRITYGDNAGKNDNQLDSPASACVDASGNVYVLDYKKYRVQKWAPGAKAGSTIVGALGFGSNLNQLNSYFSGIIVRDGFLYVADRFNYRVLRFALP